MYPQRIGALPEILKYDSSSYKHNLHPIEITIDLGNYSILVYISTGTAGYGYTLPQRIAQDLSMDPFSDELWLSPDF